MYLDVRTPRNNANTQRLRNRAPINEDQPGRAQFGQPQHEWTGDKPGRPVNQNRGHVGIPPCCPEAAQVIREQVRCRPGSRRVSNWHGLVRTEVRSRNWAHREEGRAMRKLAVIEFVTLDGVMQSLGSPDEDREGGFEYGGWSAPYGDEVLGKAAGEGMAATTAYLFGRKTYQHMAAHWPTEPDTNPTAAHLNATPKYVVTRTLTRLEWGRLPRARRRCRRFGQRPQTARGRRHRRARQRCPRADADRPRHRRRVPAVRTPAGARRRKAAVPADPSAGPAAAHRLHPRPPPACCSSATSRNRGDHDLTPCGAAAVRISLTSRRRRRRGLCARVGCGRVRGGAAVSRVRGAAGGSDH